MKPLFAVLLVLGLATGAHARTVSLPGTLPGTSITKTAICQSSAGALRCTSHLTVTGPHGGTATRDRAIVVQRGSAAFTITATRRGGGVMGRHRAFWH